MANAWTGHFYKEAQIHKMIYDQVSLAYDQYEAQWKTLDLEAAHWTEIADVIRWANSMARESFSSGSNYMLNMVEHQREGSIIGAKKRMESFANANRHIPDWTKAAVARWDKFAAEYGVTLVDNKNEDIEIPLMADASLIDIYRYTGTKWSEAEARSLAGKVREKFDIAEQDFSAWMKIRGIASEIG